MFPKQSGTLTFHKNPKSLVDWIRKEFQQNKRLKIKHEASLENGKFTLIKRNQAFNPFERKIILSEIRGKITESYIHYEISISNGWTAISGIHLVILTLLALKFLIGGEYENGVTIIGFMGLLGLVIYFWIKNENHYLEAQFLHAMKNA